MSGALSVSESIEWRDWQTEGPTSGWGSLSESSSFVPWFSTFVFRNVPGTVPECICICGFKRNSSNLERAPKMRDSVLLSSWDSFLVTLPSISSETCVIYSSLILGTDVFRDWPLLGCFSCVSLVTAANFRLFPSENFLSPSLEKLRRGPISSWWKFGYRKFFCIRWGITIFHRKISVQHCRKFSWGTILCFRKFLLWKKFWKREWGYHVFPSELFCLTVPKIFVGRPFCFKKFLVW